MYLALSDIILISENNSIYLNKVFLGRYFNFLFILNIALRYLLRTEDKEGWKHSIIQCSSVQVKYNLYTS